MSKVDYSEMLDDVLSDLFISTANESYKKDFEIPDDEWEKFVDVGQEVEYEIMSQIRDLYVDGLKKKGIYIDE